MESKGIRVNMNETKVTISGERQKVRQKAARWHVAVCSKGVGSNSLQCTSCQKWVHKKSYNIISYQGFLVRPLLREPRPQVHYKSQPDATAQRETQKSTNVKSLTKIQ